MSIILNSFENIFGTGPDAAQIGANLESMTIRDLTVSGNFIASGTITLGGFSLQSYVLPGVGIPAGVISITSTLGANMPLVLAPRGTGGISMGIPDGTVAGGNARGPRSVDFQVLRTAATQVASGIDSFIAASLNSTAAGQFTVALASANANISASTFASISSNIVTTDAFAPYCVSIASFTTNYAASSILSAVIAAGGVNIINSTGVAVMSAGVATMNNSNSCLAAASTNSALNTCTLSAMLCSSNSTLNTCNNVCAVGANLSVTGVNNCFIFSDGSAGTIAPPNSDSFTVRSTGATAAVFYTNAGATTGVSLAAGASAWAAVSDRALKENIAPMNPAEAAETIRRLPIYTYNFIGNPAEQRCVGPMAQDWAGAFPSNKSPKHIEYNDVLGMTVAALQCCLDRIEKLEAQLKK